nr:PAS domain S-box protein [Salinarchaeum laminariae]
MNSADSLFSVIDDDFTYVRWNDRFETVTGYSSSLEIRELSPMDLFDDDTNAEIEGEIERILEDGERVVVEADLVISDDGVLPDEYLGVPAEDAGTIVGVVGIGRRVARLLCRSLTPNGLRTPAPVRRSPGLRCPARYSFGERRIETLVRVSVCFEAGLLLPR